MEIDYTQSPRFSNYFCESCGRGKRKRVKLWRAQNALGSHPQLRCVDCAARETGVNSRSVKANGQHYVVGAGVWTTVMGSLYVLAVPAEVEGYQVVNYWSRMSVPDAPHAWWVALPLR